LLWFHWPDAGPPRLSTEAPAARAVSRNTERSMPINDLPSVSLAKDAQESVQGSETGQYFNRLIA